MDEHAPSDEEAFWGAPTATAAPPPPPETREGDDFWGPEVPTDKPRPVRQWLAAGIGTTVVALVAWGGIGLARNESTTLAGAAGPGGRGGFGGPGGFGGRGTDGTVASIDGSKFTVTTPGGETVTVATSSSTTFSTASTGSVADLKAGDNVTVVGTTSGTTVDAERITDTGSTAPTDGAPNGASPPGISDGRGGAPTGGIVEAVNGSSLTVTTAASTSITVNTTSATVVSLVRPSSLGALKLGDEVQVNGTTSNGTVEATSVRTGVAGFGPVDGRGQFGPRPAQGQTPPQGQGQGQGQRQGQAPPARP